MGKKNTQKKGYYPLDLDFQNSFDQLDEIIFESEGESSIAFDRAVAEENFNSQSQSSSGPSDVQLSENNLIAATRSSSSFENSISSVNSAKSIKREFLEQKRRPKGYKNKIEQKVNGYWSKNFLQFGKTYHFEAIHKKKGRRFVQENKTLQAIYEKKGMSLEDYEFLYGIEELKQVWQQFFAHKVLYRELMLSRTLSNYKVVYLHFMGVFEKAFKEKKFGSLKGLL